MVPLSPLWSSLLHERGRIASRVGIFRARDAKCVSIDEGRSIGVGNRPVLGVAVVELPWQTDGMARRCIGYNGPHMACSPVACSCNGQTPVRLLASQAVLTHLPAAGKSRPRPSYLAGDRRCVCHESSCRGAGVREWCVCVCYGGGRGRGQGPSHS